VNRAEALWPLGRYTFGWLGALTARVRYYGSERIPRSGGVVLALNHFSWIDIPCFGVACPRNTYFVAKVEAHRVPGLGQFIRTFGAISIRRGESDREAVRQMRQVVRDGGVLGLFV
jgi:1-acyl-sn-glycerol-3-phosphate acyltransferase